MKNRMAERFANFSLSLPLSIIANNRLSVLLFHKVPNVADPLNPNDLDLKTFERVIDFISQRFSVIPLNDAVDGIKMGKLPPKAACITFDDGYSDWLSGVVPALEKRNLHATFFVTSEQFSGPGMWHERVLEAVRRATGPVLDLVGFGLPALSIHSDADRQRAIAMLEAFLKYQQLSIRNELIGRLEQLVGIGSHTAPRMSLSDLRALHNRGFGIGAHTTHHPILSLCDPAEAMREIGGVREELAGLIGGRVNSFAYPNGRPVTDFNADHVKMVERAGYTSAVTTQWGSADRRTPIFQIPRFTPWGPGSVNMALQIGRNLLTRPRLISLPPQRPVKVLFVENGAGFGGAVVALQTLVAHMPAQLVECGVVSNLPVGDFSHSPVVMSHEVIHDRVVDVRPVAKIVRAASRLGPLRNPILFGLGRIDDLLNRLPYLLRLSWLILRLRPDIVHGNNEPSSNREAMLVARLLRKPYVQHLRGNLGFSRQTPWLLTKPNYFIPVSRWLAAELMQAGVGVERIRQIYDAVEFVKSPVLGLKGTFRNEMSIPTDAIIVAMIGMLVVWKGQDLFIEAVKHLGDLGRPVVFLLVGGTPERGDKEYAVSLYEKVKAYGLQDRILFTGQRSDVPALLEEVDVVVSASTDPEPLGLVMLEAMLKGCIFVAPAHGAATEVVVDGENGYLFKPRSAESLAEKLLEAIQAFDRADGMTEKAKNVVEQQFTGERCASATLNLHRSIFHGQK